MDFFKKYSALMLLFVGCGTFTGCSDDDPEPPVNNGNNDDPQVAVSDEIFYANCFGKDVLSQYYYWCDEIAADLRQWDEETNEDPIGTVDRIKYHEGDKYIDKWTMMTDDVASFNSSMEGVSTTYGWNLTVYQISSDDNLCFGVVNFVYAGSPAEKAGLKRGDILAEMDGEYITTDNYTDLYYAPSLTVTLGELEGNTIYARGREVSLSAVTMYEDPVLCDSVYEFGGKKVGYLAYSSFDMQSIGKLVEIGKKFKAEGVSEVVLDLRYNGGGYVITEQVLASLFAPQASVSAGSLFESEVYNDYLTALYEANGISLDTYLATEFEYNGLDGQTHSISTKDANVSPSRVYGIISGNTASASEALLGGLMPYVEVRTVGTQSYGKYCTGFILGGEDWYGRNCPDEISNWGIYVMVSIYENSAGETPCMPDGIQPDVEMADDQIPSYALGDVDEPLLRAALTEAGRTYASSQAVSRGARPPFTMLPAPRKASFGKRILPLPSGSCGRVPVR